jgi:hypothetical protein
MGGGLYPSHLFVTFACRPRGREETMKHIKVVVKVKRRGTHTEYVQRIDRTPIQMTADRKLVLTMGKFTAEDAVKSLQTSRCSSELVSVQVSA